MPQVILTNIIMYKNIVENHYKEYQNLSALYDKTKKDVTTTHNEDVENALYEIELSMDSEAFIIIAFSYMTIEAFCNIYLTQHVSKKNFKKFCFLKKLNTTISMLFSDNKISVSKNKAQEFYGSNIQKLVNMRNNMVHRYPVRFDLSIKSDISFKKGSAAAARQIENAYLRRINRVDVEMAATAYTKLLDSFKSAGINLSNLTFQY